MTTWQLQKAKTHLSELLARAHEEGPQVITRHGVERVVVLSMEEYKTLAAHKPDFRSHLLGGPKVDEFTIDRSKDSGRTIEF